MDKATLSKKSVLALERLAKKVGAKTVTPDGKKKNKTQLVNSIIMASRLGKKNPALKAKKSPAKKATAKKTTAKKVVRKPVAKKTTRRRLLAGRTKADYIQDFAKSAISRYQINPKKSFDTIFNEMVQGFSSLGVRSAYERVGELNFFDWRNAPRQPKNMQDLVVLAFENIYTEVKDIFDRQKQFLKK